MGGPNLELLLNEVVDGLYEAAAEPDSWTDTLDILDRLFGAQGAHLFLWDEATQRRIAAHRSRSFAENHPEWDYYQRLNPRRKIMLGLPYGTPMNCADYIDDAAVSRSEFFTDYSLPAGRRYLLGTNAIKQGSVVTAFAVIRAPEQKPFDAGNTAMLARLMPDLRRAARIDRRMRAMRQEDNLTSAALDRLDDAVLIVDGMGRIVRGNAAAERMFRANGPLRARVGRLSACRDADTSRLRALIVDAAAPSPDVGTNPGGIQVLETPDRERWAVIVAPLMPRATLFDVSGQRLALVIASNLAVSASIEVRLRQAFALTRAEARLASKIIAGLTLDEIGHELGVSLATLRTQLKAVFHKTETNRQGQLMQLGSRLVRVAPP